MRSFAILDDQCRFTFINQTSEGTYAPEDLLGGRPWDWVNEPEREWYESTVMEVCNGTKERASFALPWVMPENPTLKRFYYLEYVAIRLSKKAWIAGHFWEFPFELSALTKTQLLILEHMGVGLTPKEVASRIDRSPNTVHHHIKGIRERLGLDGIDQVVALAARYVEANSSRL